MQPLWVTLNPVLRFLAIFKYFANIKMMNDYIEIQLDTMLVEKVRLLTSLIPGNINALRLLMILLKI